MTDIISRYFPLPTRKTFCHFTSPPVLSILVLILRPAVEGQMTDRRLIPTETHDLNCIKQRIYDNILLQRLQGAYVTLFFVGFGTEVFDRCQR